MNFYRIFKVFKSLFLHENKVWWLIRFSEFFSIFHSYFFFIWNFDRKSQISLTGYVFGPISLKIESQLDWTSFDRKWSVHPENDIQFHFRATADFIWIFKNFKCKFTVEKFKLKIWNLFFWNQHKFNYF